MVRVLSQMVASLSMMLRQSLPSFCDIETSHGPALVTRNGDYVSMIRIDGARRMMSRADVEAMAESQRLEISSALEGKGHAVVGWYVSDPALSGVEIERMNLGACRNMADRLNVDLEDILDERAARWPSLMRWEAAYYVLWTRRSVLTKEERKQVKEEQNELAKQFSKVGNSQRYYMRSETMSARHASFVQRILSSLSVLDVACEELDPHDALRLTRESIYRETAGSPWRPSLPGDPVMARMPDDTDLDKPHPQGLLWPSLREQIFSADAQTHGGQRVAIGDYEYAPVDMAIGPDDPRPFIELAAKLGRSAGGRRIPWRASFIIEGGGRTAMSLKDVGAGFLSMFPGNGDIRRAFQALRTARETDNHISVKLRASFATWAPAGETRALRRQVATLSQNIEGWGNCKATQISGDPLEATLSSVPGLALASTANPSLALLGDALSMMPTNRTAAPWQEGAVLFRRPDGSMVPYDPVGGNIRPLVCDIFVAPPGGGKSVMANTINLGLCLSTAAMGNRGARLPLIGRIDIGKSAHGFVEMLRNALGPAREHEVIFTSMQLAPGYEVNVFDLQLGCEYPLPLERSFLQNFLALITAPLGGTPFEGMDHLIGRVIDEVFRLCTDVPGGRPKIYRPGVAHEVDDYLRRSPGAMQEHNGGDHVVWWRDVVNLLIAREEYRLAEIAQRQAVPVMSDLIEAIKSPAISDAFRDMRIHTTNEPIVRIFERYIYDFIRRYESLAQASRLDFGSARIIVMDLGSVAPTGSDLANRQTEIMYMIARQIIARNFFLHPDAAENAPAAIQPYLRERFRENVETIKRLDYDEWHRTAGSRQVQAQAELDVREGRKHNVQIGFASQHLADFSDQLVADSTARFVLKTGDEKEAAEIIHRFKLSDASAAVVRHHLPGPGPAGAPFLLVMQAEGKKYEQLLINSLGPVELWAFSTTPADTALRERLYTRIGSSDALRRLATVFPKGSAGREIERRKKDRLRGGGSETEAETGVVDGLAAEILNGEGIAMILRDSANSNQTRQVEAAE